MLANRLTGRSRITPKKEIEDPTLDFDNIVSNLERLSPRAQATFSHKFVTMLPKNVLKTLHYYAGKKLEDAKGGNIRSLGKSAKRGRIGGSENIG